MSDERPPRRRSRVPAGRLERLARFGWMAGEFAAGGLVEGTRRFFGGAAADTASALLNPENARRLAQRLSRLRGAAMKLGQLLSLESTDVLPPEFAEALAVLRASADTMPPAQVRRVLGREYGKGWEARFADFDWEPLAAASIGQVHAATAIDGRRLALKIQYPGIARSIDSDVDNVAALLRLGRFLPGEIDLSGILEEAKRQLRQEADYLVEAEHLRRYAALLEDEPALRVPRVHDDLSTRRVLAMDRIDGEPIEALTGAGVAQSRRDAVGRTLERLVFRELFEFHFMQTDPNFANYLIEPETDRIALLDLGSARAFDPEFCERYARIVRATLTGDRRALRAAAVAIGYLDENEREDRARGVEDLILLICEPLRHAGVYDFGRSRIPSRTRDLGFDLAFRKGFLRPPPPETVFLHRKLVGSFLLCARIRARVDVNALIRPLIGL
ncbi:MAG: AarF/ABC1/UbiB kinase family protein [Methylococcaceae bacterium]|nr:AarF/ABC1/UbiB kinase family protein [Methylococcaceae bacterium]